MDIVKSLAEYSGGFFLREQNSWTRIPDSDSWKVFKHPVEIWFHEGELTVDAAVQLKGMLKQVPNVTRIRFLGTKIGDAAREQL
jgi:hypothetical protein